MQHSEAIDLIRSGIKPGAEQWADLGAGAGTFSLALADLLGPSGKVFAVDRKLPAIASEETSELAEIISLQGDFTQALPLSALDGILMANALHFVSNKRTVLRHILSYLKPGGSFLLIEYDTQDNNPWVPFPIRKEDFQPLALSLGLSKPHEIGRYASKYGNREMYAVKCNWEKGL